MKYTSYRSWPAALRRTAAVASLVGGVVACSDSTGPGDVSQITLSTTQATLLVGDTFHLAAVPRDAKGTAVDKQTVTWSSSNPAISTVDASTGLVTAITAGTDTVTATDGAISAQAVIVVVTLSSS